MTTSRYWLCGFTQSTTRNGDLEGVRGLTLHPRRVAGPLAVGARCDKKTHRR